MAAVNLRVLDQFASEWRLCKRKNGRMEVEVIPNGETRWVACGEGRGVADAFNLAVQLMVSRSRPATPRLILPRGFEPK